MKWSHGYTQLFDSREIYTKQANEWHTDDFKYQKATGEVVSGAEKAFEALKETYAPFEGTSHEPNWLCCWETDNGWEMVGQAVMFANLKAPGGSGQVQTDLSGKKWDVGVPSAFHFEYVKDPSGPAPGIKLKRSEVYGDSAPVVVEMLKRGMLKPEQLMG